MEVEVTVGPVPSSSAAAWLGSAEETLRVLRADAVEVPWDVLLAFEQYVDTWRRHLATAGETFEWRAPIDEQVLRRVGLHWARMVSVARSGRPAGLAAAPPEAAAFYDSIARGIANAIASGDPGFASAFAEAVPAFHSERAAPRGTNGTASVLIVDAEEDSRLLLRAWLERDAGLAVAGEACDAHRGIELARLKQPVVAVIDPQLPDMRAADVIPLIRSAAPNVSVVAVSRDARQQMLAMSAGATQFLCKSQPIAAVLEAVHRAAARS